MYKESSVNIESAEDVYGSNSFFISKDIWINVGVFDFSTFYISRL